jgi:hypothetical protein
VSKSRQTKPIRNPGKKEGEEIEMPEEGMELNFLLSCFPD